MKANAVKKGFMELDPNQTAVELFGHLNAGDKVAIVTRFADDESEYVTSYVRALESRGLKVRLIRGQTGVEDFCFLMSATKEIIGVAVSTYLVWAGLLSDTVQRVLAYSLESTERADTGRDVFIHYNWTHPELQRRIQFQLLRPNIPPAEMGRLLRLL